MTKNKYLIKNNLNTIIEIKSQTIIKKTKKMRKLCKIEFFPSFTSFFKRFFFFLTLHKKGIYISHSMKRLPIADIITMLMNT